MLPLQDKDYLHFINSACEKHKIAIRYDSNSKMKSWSGGGDEIFIGDFSGDEELIAISFAHELGHCLLEWEFKEKTEFNTVLIELECWHIGIKYALDNFGLVFSDRAIKWGLEQLFSYCGHDERERLGWKFKKTLSKEAKGN